MSKAPKIAQEGKTLKHGLNFNSATIKGLALSSYQHDCTLTRSCSVSVVTFGPPFPSPTIAW
jgi:hypothetical protein